MREVRVGVIGAGGAAQVVHLPILKRLPDLEVAAVVDAREDKARTIAERGYRVALFGNGARGDD